MNREKTLVLRDAFFAVLALAFILFLHGAVPFFATPASSQAIWTTGFSLSFINESIFSIYAKNFGAPMPAAIAFGLAGAWPTAVLLKLGLYPADAYSAMVAFWISIGFYFAYKIARFFDTPPLIAIFGATLWMSMPIIWLHDGYSMTGLGIGLLPFYFWATLKLFFSTDRTSIGIYLAATLIAVFMDGYTFMMFAVGATMLCAYILIIFPELRKHILWVGVPTHILSFAISYFLYTSYVGVTSYDIAPIDMFRGWGLDLSFMVIPTQGVHWIFDALGLSISRSNKLYFGDDSVWASTFFLPLLLVGLFSWWCIRPHLKISSGILLVAAFSFYMAMGPSLKINSIKPQAMQQTTPGALSAFMPPELALAATGNEWISKNLPGFKSMRSTYRWSALSIFCLWLLCMIYLASKFPKNNFPAELILFCLICLNLPNLNHQWPLHMAYRNNFFKIDSELVASLKKALHRHELVVFLPFKNDFLINYAAPKLDIRTYNIGGDKNLQEAHKRWPTVLQKFKFNRLDNTQLPDILQLLISNDVDAVVIPYFDTSSAADMWPCSSAHASTYVGCITEKKLTFAPIIDGLKQSAFLNITNSDFFATVRLKPEFATESGKRAVRIDLITRNPNKTT